MPAKGISMHKIKDILRLHFEAQLSQHQIAASLQLSSGVVNKYLALSRSANLPWPLPEEIDEVKLHSLKHSPRTKTQRCHAFITVAGV